MSDAEKRKFTNYCLSFYGSGGLYPFKPPMKASEVAFAYDTLKRADSAGDWSWGDGDSVDRERVRDLVLLKRRKAIVGIGPYSASAEETAEFVRVFEKYGAKRRSVAKAKKAPWNPLADYYGSPTHIVREYHKKAGR